MSAAGGVHRASGRTPVFRRAVDCVCSIEVARRLGGEFGPAAGAAEDKRPPVMLEAELRLRRIDRHPADGVLGFFLGFDQAQWLRSLR